MCSSLDNVVSLFMQCNDLDYFKCLETYEDHET